MMQSFIIRTRAFAVSRLLTWLAAAPALLCIATALVGAETKNVFLITADGLRWEEVYRGAEEMPFTKQSGNFGSSNSIRKEFWRGTPEARREVLFPFLWGTVAKQGQLWGNRDKRSTVRVSNGHNFSYPGYNEFLTGYADPRIDSNDKKLNPNTNVFEWLNSKPAFQGRVAAAVNWDVLPWILNAPRSGFPVWSAWDVPEGTRRLPVPEALTEMAERSRTVWPNVILDTFVGYAAKHAVRTLQPRAMYVSFGETDDWAHEGNYERYLKAAREFDRFIGELWALVQSMPEYRGTTTFFITVDHGRGPAPEKWRDHGKDVTDSAYTWFGVIGPDTPPRGERSGTPAIIQAQVAATVAAFMSEDFKAAFPNRALPIVEVLGPARGEDSRRAAVPLPSSVRAIEARGLQNVFAAGTNVFSGNSPESDDGFAALAKLGVKTIISVDGARPDVEAARKHGLRYVHLPHGYDGISKSLQLQLAKAGESLAGPIYVHCHHGKHRGPAAAAIICMASQGWTPTQAEAWLIAAGTATNYAGLYDAVRGFSKPNVEEMRSVPNEFPETAKVSGLVDAMVGIDERWEHLKAVRTANYSTPTKHPDIKPANEAIILWEHFREAQRLSDAARHGTNFIERLKAAEAEATETERLLRVFAAGPRPEIRQQLDRSFDSMGKSCASCHKAYRDGGPGK
jgi:hypothetical protein